MSDVATMAGEWDGVIHCEVLEVIPNKRLVHSWSAGHEANDRYGSRLETVVIAAEHECSKSLH